MVYIYYETNKGSPNISTIHVYLSWWMLFYKLYFKVIVTLEEEKEGKHILIMNIVLM